VQQAERNKAVVCAFVEAVNGQDWDRLDDLVAAEFVRHSHAAGPPPIHSRHELKAFLRAEFERVNVETHERQPIRILSYCVLSNHWHFVVWPEEDGQLGEQAIKASLSPWPVERPANWTARVNTPLTAKELDRVRVSIERGRPYGGDDWVRQTVTDLGLERTVRPEGRPRKASQ
jgi:SnoaL-like domain